jgi:hypothetical protein
MNRTNAPALSEAIDATLAHRFFLVHFDEAFRDDDPARFRSPPQARTRISKKSALGGRSKPATIGGDGDRHGSMTAGPLS